MNLPPPDPWSSPPVPPPAAPSSRWKTWHKVTLGVVGVLASCLCGVAVFAPDPPDQRSPEPAAGTAAVAQRVATTNPATNPPTERAAEPTAGRTPSATPTRKPSPSATKKRTASPEPVFYADCDAAPGELARGEPGYRKALDRDGDGTACESADDDEPIEMEVPEPDGTDPRFGSCAKAKAAGYGPYLRGSDPEYDWYQDRDKDGVVCE